jgi:predicted  nucleic acid-binding Zn-ribbon protein
MLTLSIIFQFRNESLRLVWKHDFREKEKAIHARYQQIEMADEMKGQTKKWQDVKKGLEDQVAAQSEEIQMLNIQIRALNQALRETETRLKADFQKQMQFNTANENQIKRVQGKVTAGEAVLREINGLMSKYLKKKGRVLTTEERMNLDSYEFSFMIPDFEVFVEQYNELLKIKQLYAALREEKEYVLTYINGYAPNNLDDMSLREEFKQYLIKNDEAITKLKDQISESEIIIGGQQEQVEKMIQDTQTEKKKFTLGTNVWQSAIMNVMRNQLQDLKRDIRLKESRIQFCESETTRLKNTIVDLKQEAERAKHERRSIPSSKTRHTISLEMNGRISVNSEDSITRIEALDDFSDYRTEVPKQKEPLLPPMSQQAIQAATTPTSPRKAPKPKPFPVTTKLEHGGRYQTAILQHGLTTAPVRLENRNVDKYAQMPFGFGDMKQMQSSGKSKFEKSLLPPKIRN